MKFKGNLDDIEDVVFDDKLAAPKEIALLRREITTLRRIVIPLKRILLDFSKDIQKFSELDFSLYFDIVTDHTTVSLVTFHNCRYHLLERKIGLILNTI